MHIAHGNNFSYQRTTKNRLAIPSVSHTYSVRLREICHFSSFHSTLPSIYSALWLLLYPIHQTYIIVAVVVVVVVMSHHTMNYIFFSAGVIIDFPVLLLLPFRTNGRYDFSATLHANMK